MVLCLKARMRWGLDVTVQPDSSLLQEELLQDALRTGQASCLWPRAVLRFPIQVSSYQGALQAFHERPFF